jgi:hypothetical protein
MIRKMVCLSALLLTSSAALGTEGAIDFLQPLGSEVFHQGETITIKFVVNRELVKDNESMVLYISFDKGRNYFSIVDEMKWTYAQYFSGDTGTVRWTIPDSMTVIEIKDTTTASTIAKDSATLWLDAPYGRNAFSANTDFFTILQGEERPEETSPAAPKANDACGRGALGALLPPMFFKCFRRKKRTAQLSPE